MNASSLPRNSSPQSRNENLRLEAGSNVNHQSYVTEIEGAILYRSFLSEEFRRSNLPEPGQILNLQSVFHSIPDPSEPYLLRYANQLRIVANGFYRSPAHILIEEQAARVPIDQLDVRKFSDLLYGLFQEGGVTCERVVVLYYFCTNLAIRAFQENLSTQLNNIVEWSIAFFTGERMLRWVLNHGGWANILENTAAHVCKIVRVGFFMLGVIAFASYIWRARILR